MKADSRRLRRRRLPAALLPGLALVFIALAGLKASGAGPDLPGPKIFDALGLSSGSKPLQYCSPKPGQIKDPASPRPAPGSWRREPNVPVPAAEQIAAVVGGQIYIVGGQDYLGRTTRRAFSFDPATRRYTRLPDMPTRADHTVVVAYRGDVYVVAGYFNSDPIAWFLRYSPRTRKWTVMPKPPIARGGAGGGMIGHRLYVAGGAPRSDPNFGVTPYRNLEIYDFKTGRWSRGPDMPTGRHHVGGVTVGDKLFIAGGRSGHQQAMNNFEVYDARTNRWTKLPPLPVGVSAMGLVRNGSDVIMSTGADDDPFRTGEGFVSPQTWAYDTRTGHSKWRRLPDFPRGQHAAAYAVADGRIWSFAGIDCPGFHPTGDAYSLPVG